MSEESNKNKPENPETPKKKESLEKKESLGKKVDAVPEEAMIKTPEAKPDKAPESKPAKAAPLGKAIPKVAPKIGKTKSKVDKPAKKRWLLPLLRLSVPVLLLAGLVMLAYMFIEQDKALEVLFTQQNQRTEQWQSNTTELESLQGTLQNLSDELGQANALVAEQKLELESQEREIISNRLRINDSGGASNRIWTLTEAESLLRLAQQRLIVSRDIRAALALFVASDDILKQINDPAVFSIRNILASDMTALRGASEVDVQGIYLQLGALAQNVTTMRVAVGIIQPLNTSEDVTEENESAEEDAGFFASMLSSFDRYLVVRRRDEPIQPLLSPEQEFYLKQNITLLLEQARLSLLQEREEIFRSSIQQAITSIELYLEADGREKESLISALEILLETPILTQVPVVSNTLTAMQQMLPLVGSEVGDDND